MKQTAIFDLGTSSLKVSIFDDNGHLLEKTEFPYPTYTEKGYIEQSTRDWEDAFRKGISWIKGTYGVKGIKAISFTGQMEDIIIGERVILYSDTRGEKSIEKINNIVGKENLYKILGNYIDPMMPLTKLYEERENIDKKRVFLFGGKDYLIYLITGKYVIDPTTASTTGLYNIRKKYWEESLLELLGLKKENLPTILPPDEVVGRTNGTFGLPEGIVVVNGMGDAGASALGMGVKKDGASVYLGTTGWITTVRDYIEEKGIPGIFTLDFIDGDYLFIGAPLNVGKVYTYLKEIFKEVSVSEYKRENFPIFLPYLSGERSPFTDPYALSSWIGISDRTKKEELIFSAMEGVCFSLYHTKEVLLKEKRLSELLLTGGVTKNELWCGVFSNVFGTKVVLSEELDSPTLGAYILSKKAFGEKIEPDIKKKRELIPDSGLFEFHRERYKLYKKLYPLLKDIYYKLRS